MVAELKNSLEESPDSSKRQWVTPTGSNPRESATETILSFLAKALEEKGEKLVSVAKRL